MAPCPHFWNLGSENTNPCEGAPGDAASSENREKLIWKRESQRKIGLKVGGWGGDRSSRKP